MKRIEEIRTDDRLMGKVSAVDLFCGAGGLTHGLEKAGIEVRLGVDIDPTCEYPYTANNKAEFLLKSVEDLDPHTIEKAFGKKKFRLLAGCAPCQTFSTYNQKATPNDKRWWLLLQFLRHVEELSPELVTMENVPRLRNQDVFKVFLESLYDSGYHVFHSLVDCEDYGVPQRRQRLVLLASKLGSIRLLSPTEFAANPTKVQDRIAHLKPLNAGEVDQDDPLHQASNLSLINMKRIISSRPGGSWRDWEESLVADCHKKDTGKKYRSVYGRMRWDEPAPTITTEFFEFGSGRFGHPEQDRAISLREGAVLQTFPIEYEFVPTGQTISKKKIARLIGNAVPPTLGEVIGQSILLHVDLWSKRN